MSHSNDPLTHFNDDGLPKMVDVGGKQVTQRSAVAKSRISMAGETRSRIQSQSMAKGDVLQTAIIAGIQAAKQTSLLIPMCHIVPLDGVDISVQWLDTGELEFTVAVQATARTGVEMEALVAASTAALTVYDMCKAIDRGMTVTHIGLWHKSGGKSGDFNRSTNQNLAP
jgi:cyclic pyranopterin monophosphate synthase